MLRFLTPEKKQFNLDYIGEIHAYIGDNLIAKCAASDGLGPTIVPLDEEETMGVSLDCDPESSGAWEVVGTGLKEEQMCMVRHLVSTAYKALATSERYLHYIMPQELWGIMGVSK